MKARLTLALVALLLGAAAELPGQGAAQVGQAPDSATLALLDRVARAYQSDRTLSASFTQLMVNPRTKTELTARGRFYQQGSARFAFRFTEPDEDVIAADSVGVWLYLPSTAKGQAVRLPRAMGAGLDIASALLRDPRRRYTVVLHTDSLIERVPVRVLQLAPKAGADVPFSRATLWIDDRALVIRRVAFTELSGLERILTFTEVRIGERIPAERFEFVAPPGVRVMDQLGPRKP